MEKVEQEQIVKFVIECLELKGEENFMGIVRYIWEKGIDCKQQDVANRLHEYCVNHKRLSKEPYFYKIGRGLYRLANDGDRLNELLLAESERKQANDLDQERIEENKSDKKIIISEFTKSLLLDKRFLLDHSDNTRIRFSTDELDSVVGFIGEGWSKKIKRLLLFEIENREDKYTLKLIIGPGNPMVREELYLNAKQNLELYARAKNSLTSTYTTIYSKKILNQEQLSNFSLETLKECIKQGLEEFINNDLARLCQGLKSQQQVDLECQFLEIENDSVLNELSETERSICIKGRIGHSTLKEMLVKKERCCKICGLSDERFLIASHIKPWSKCNHNERLDLNNVLLLCPQHDSAFDKGYITFNQDGTMLISSELNPETGELLNLNLEKKIDLSSEQTEYILWHKENIFHV